MKTLQSLCSHNQFSVVYCKTRGGGLCWTLFITPPNVIFAIDEVIMLYLALGIILCSPLVGCFNLIYKCCVLVTEIVLETLTRSLLNWHNSNSLNICKTVWHTCFNVAHNLAWCQQHYVIYSIHNFPNIFFHGQFNNND